MAKGQMKIEILEDGTVKSETSDMSGANHQSADDFLKEIARLLGGEVVEEKLKKDRHHHHQHDEQHHHH